MFRSLGRLETQLAALSALWLVSFASVSHATEANPGTHADLAIVSPVLSCEALPGSDLDTAVGAKVTGLIATSINTPKGPYCRVTGNIEPSIGFEVDLPTQHWTQRFLMGGCGGLCGMTSVGIRNASTCGPALNGEFVVAGTDMGHRGKMGSDDEAAFASDPQKRIDFAYRANHVTTLAAKALIQSYYGQPARYAYFVGCSDGGREALMEAQRYPDDFDGIAAGDPAAMFTLQNSFYHAWVGRADQRADGSNILMPAKLQLLHDAVIAHCDTLSGVKDQLLQDPRACDFDPASLQCPAKAGDTSKCLTAEELGVVRKLYEGASDGHGHGFTFGAEPGSESQWHLPSRADGKSMSSNMAGRMVANVILPQVSPADADVSKFQFTEQNFQRMQQTAALYNATNTNLKPFATHGGKLILWHGWSDTSITPGVSIAYYQGVQNFMGADATDRFMKLFLLPGVGHCGGGDGYDEVDVLSPLMAWTERQQAPKMLLSGKSRHPRMGPPGPQAGAPGMHGPNGPQATGPASAGPADGLRAPPPHGAPFPPPGPGLGPDMDDPLMALFGPLREPPAPPGGPDRMDGPMPPPPGGPDGMNGPMPPPPGGPDRMNGNPHDHVPPMDGMDASHRQGAGPGMQAPYAEPAQGIIATRPVFPYPYVARFTGKGDPLDAANYVAVKSPVKLPESFTTEAMQLIGPDNQKRYHVDNGHLVSDPLH